MKRFDYSTDISKKSLSELKDLEHTYDAIDVETTGNIDDFSRRLTIRKNELVIDRIREIRSMGDDAERQYFSQYAIEDADFLGAKFARILLDITPERGVSDTVRTALRDRAMVTSEKTLAYGIDSTALGDWKEGDHPRGKDGKFGSGGGSHKAVEDTKAKHDIARKDYDRVKSQHEHFEDKLKKARESKDSKRISEAQKNFDRSKKKLEKSESAHKKALEKHHDALIEHAGIKASSTNRATTAHIAKAVVHTGLSRTLEKHPVSSTEIVPELYGNKIRKDGSRAVTNGVYRHDTKELRVRQRDDGFGKKFVPGKSHSISATAATAEDAMQRTMAHELHHHVHGVIYQKHHDIAWEIINHYTDHVKDKEGVAITKYAHQSEGEYFAETMAAYHYERDRLRQHDPAGYAIAEKVFGLIRQNRLSILLMTSRLPDPRMRDPETTLQPITANSTPEWRAVRPYLVEMIKERQAGTLTKDKAESYMSDAEDEILALGRYDKLLAADLLEMFGHELPMSYLK